MRRLSFPCLLSVISLTALCGTGNAYAPQRDARSPAAPAAAESAPLVLAGEATGAASGKLLITPVPAIAPIDVTKTPSPGGPVPVPYPNAATATKSSPKAKTRPPASAPTRKPTPIGRALTPRADGKAFPSRPVTVKQSPTPTTSNAPAGQQVAPSQTKVIVAP